MNYVAYHKETTVYLCTHRGVKTNHRSFGSAGAAKAAITREAKRGAISASDFAVLDVQAFSKIEKTKVVKNIMSGQPVVESVNTPWGCSVASETYWAS